MKKTMIKFCDERNRRFCIRTVIAEDEKTKEKFVFKSSIYPEGEKHIRNIVDNADLLKKVYPEVGICPVRMTDHNQVQFEYIKGRSLADFYQEAVLHNDREEIQRLLKIHADLLKGSSENICEFEMTSQFQEVFGLDEWNGDKRALKTSNFDGNSNNIIYQGDKPFFIDYEWVFDFPIPEEIVIFYNLRYVYLNIKGVDALYPMHEAKRMLNISIDDELIEKISWSFFSYVHQEEDGISYALSKSINAKGTKKYQDYDLRMKNCEDYDVLVKKCEDYDFIVKNWQDAVQANALLSKRIQMLEAAKEAEVAQEKENHRLHAKQLEDAVQEQARQSETWRIAYETVIHSRTWRIANKLKRLMGRKTQQ